MKKFEVKTGKNKGLYIVVENRAKAEKFFPKWGMLIEEYNYNFYKYHNALGKIILTCSVWARGIMRKDWERAK